MKNALFKLRVRLGSDFEYFEKVYKYTFDFARNDGQRSLGEIQISYIILWHLPWWLSISSGLETAQAFWSLLIPHGLAGGALTRIAIQDDSDEDVDMDEGEEGWKEEGWKEEYLQWWFDFLNGRGGKGVTKDTWIMVCTFDHLPSPRSFYLLMILHHKVFRLHPLDWCQILKV